MKAELLAVGSELLGPFFLGLLVYTFIMLIDFFSFPRFRYVTPTK